MIILKKAAGAVAAAAAVVVVAVVIGVREREKKVAVQFGSMRARPGPVQSCRSNSIALSLYVVRVRSERGSRVASPPPCNLVVKVMDGGRSPFTL